MNTARHFGDEIVVASRRRRSSAARSDVLAACEALLRARRRDRVDGRDRVRDFRRRLALARRRPRLRRRLRARRRLLQSVRRAPLTSSHCALQPGDDAKLVKPYGDTQNDGKVQLSFTLPVEWSEAADEAARQLAGKMGFTDVQVVDGRPIATGFSFFVLYASTPRGRRRRRHPRAVGARARDVDGRDRRVRRRDASAARSASPARASAPTRIPSASTRFST